MHRFPAKFIRCFLLMLLVTLSVAPLESKAADERPFLELSRPERGKVFAITWSPDGKYIAVGTEQGLWIYTDTFVDVTHAEDKPIHALAWSPDGKTIAAGYFVAVDAEAIYETRADYQIKGGGLRLWSVQKAGNDLTLVAGAVLVEDGLVFSTRFNADGSKLALLMQDLHLYGEMILGRDRVQIYATESGKLLYDAANQRTYLSLQDDRVTQGANGLDWNDQDQLIAIRGLNREYGPDYSIIDAASTQDVTASTYLDSGQGYGAVLSAVDWNDDGVRVAFSAVQSADPTTTWGNINICDRDDRNGGLCVELPAARSGIDDTGSVPTLAWQPRSALLAYTEGTVIHVWDAMAQKLVADLDAAYALVTMLAWKPDGAALLSAGSDYVVRLWTQLDSYQTPDPQPIQTIALPSMDRHAALSPNRQWFAQIDDSDANATRINVFNIKDSSVRTSTAPLSATQHYNIELGWSPDSSMVVSQSATPNYTAWVQVWSAETGKLLLDLGLAVNLIWRPDGKAVAIVRFGSYGDAILEIYDIASGKLLLASTPSHEWGEQFPSLEVSESHNHIFAVSYWSSDGRFIGVSDGLGAGEWGATSVKFWDTQTNTVVGDIWTPRTMFGGSGNSSSLLAWSPNDKFVAVNGFDDFFLYNIALVGDRFFSELLWQPPDIRTYWDLSATAFSTDSHYFIIEDTVIDTHTGWPIFKFRNFSYYDFYRWEEDMLIGVRASDETTRGEEIYFQNSDFLPQ